MSKNTLGNRLQKSYTKFLFCAATVVFIFTSDLANAKTNSIVEAVSDSIYTIVDEMPEVEGGISKVYEHIEYPREAILKEVEGRVFIKFVVNEKGEVKSPEVLKDIGAGCGDAAIEGIKKVKFNPGKLGGQAVKVYYTMPITFKLQKR